MPNRAVFLGCLTCSQYDSASVLNQYGTYGNRYNAESILNRYGEYGSRYSSYSPCNRYASDPPAVVDRQGNFYGYLTLNAYNSRIDDSTIIAWLTRNVRQLITSGRARWRCSP